MSSFNNLNVEANRSPNTKPIVFVEIVELVNYIFPMKIEKYLKHSPAFALNSAYETIIPSLNKSLKREGVNLLQGLVLTALFFEGNNDVSPSQLSTQFKTSKGNISHILSHLESQGWIKRSVDPEDARKFVLEIKAEGKKKALILIKIYDRLQSHFEKVFSESCCVEMVNTLSLLTSAKDIKL
jgi:DNA-binding MarR family transcriptional regulator